MKTAQVHNRSCKKSMNTEVLLASHQRAGYREGVMRNQNRVPADSRHIVSAVKLT